MKILQKFVLLLLIFILVGGLILFIERCTNYDIKFIDLKNGKIEFFPTNADESTDSTLYDIIPKETVSVKSAIFFRLLPDTTSKIIRTLLIDETLNLTGRKTKIEEVFKIGNSDQKEYWYEVTDSKSVAGWVFGAGLNFSNSEHIYNEEITVLMTTKLRASSDKDSRVIKTYLTNTIFTYLDKKVPNSKNVDRHRTYLPNQEYWYKVRNENDGNEGYLFGACTDRRKYNDPLPKTNKSVEPIAMTTASEEPDSSNFVTEDGTEEQDNLTSKSGIEQPDSYSDKEKAGFFSLDSSNNQREKPTYYIDGKLKGREVTYAPPLNLQNKTNKTITITVKVYVSQSGIVSFRKFDNNNTDKVDEFKREAKRLSKLFKFENSLDKKKMAGKIIFHFPPQ